MNDTLMEKRRRSIILQRQEKEVSLEKVKTDLQFKVQIQREIAAMKREEKEESCKRMARQEEYKKA